MGERAFVKRRDDAPEGFFEAEAAGLNWLADAGGARTVRVLSLVPGRIELEALDLARPTEAHAVALGAALARTHDAGAAAFGVPPPGVRTDSSGRPATFIGNQPLSTRALGWPSWGAFYAEQRVLPYARLAAERGHLGGGDLRSVHEACEVIASGRFDDGAPPARIHGDLWNGNVQWTAGGAVLIDPAAHGGHRETDLAMLALFGCPNLQAVYRGYNDAHQLEHGWQHRIELHQLHPLAVHAASHGAGYAAPLLAAAHAVLSV